MNTVKRTKAEHYAHKVHKWGRSRSHNTRQRNTTVYRRFDRYLTEQQQHLKDYAKAPIKGGEGNYPLTDVQRETIQTYLQARRELGICQSTLNEDRQCLQRLTGTTFPVVNALKGHEKGEKASAPRVYTDEQVEAIQRRQNDAHSFATQIALEAGLRAHELHTIRPIDEQPLATRARPNQAWNPDRYQGREGWVPYSVIGKGGLIREIRLHPETAEQLESHRLPQAVQIVDRKIPYEKHYDIKGGNAWSQAFSRASNKALSFSHGAHALRHTYAENRMDYLRSHGRTHYQALCILTQELGHFRPDITETYLR